VSNYKLLPALLIALASLQAQAQQVLDPNAAVAPTSAPVAQSQAPVAGDAYWSGGTGQSAPAIPNTSAPVAGDGYWSQSTVGPSVSPNAIWADSPDQISSDAVFSNSKNGEDEIPMVRASLIQEAAAAFGAQAGMASRTRELNNASNTRTVDYDRAFRFSDLMIEPGFLAPVVTEGRDAYVQPNSREVRVADRIYRIEIPERLVSTPPRWQEYLLLPPPTPIAPDRIARPRTTAERAWWDRWARVGWDRGVAQADQSFQSRMARLRRDFEGMVRFKSLYQQGAITMPILATSNLGVTGGGDEMAINDRIYRITEGAKLDPNAQRWKNTPPVTHRTDLPASTKPIEPGSK
jgi:defect-in-organelle-trafficking protein DotC